MNHDLDGALRLATLHRRSEQDNRAATCPRQVTPAGWDSARSHDRRRQANPSRSQLTWGWADLATVQSAGSGPIGRFRLHTSSPTTAVKKLPDPATQYMRLQCSVEGMKIRGNSQKPPLLMANFKQGFGKDTSSAVFPTE
ncbi:hypothetical protein T310_7246 [Rasamsonia emersonii CBS 393.64]|uniref:Uncharacterized protein n=1 Tax=Rasamsonia emersonii (strain ATCC 16479 / CBS 393.64 / IMI 116815) TaxID=1408163 RepID=A0A0F4YLS2_RASE3|nr:hypothetical protein T310_7246 [Rasamsonia emersonii CBS 393.64]KKA18806.1 hypothetical protein T310_7246 [Rasamsonia emersonii CBS 393.64]